MAAGGSSDELLGSSMTADLADVMMLQYVHTQSLQRAVTAITAEASEAQFLGLSLGVGLACIVGILGVVVQGLVWYLPLARRCARQDLAANTMLLLTRVGQ